MGNFTKLCLNGPAHVFYPVIGLPVPVGPGSDAIKLNVLRRVAMTIISRMVRLIKADVHGVMDSIEEPALLLKQALRDMEAEHLLLCQERDRLLQEQQCLQKRRRRIQQDLLSLQEDLDLCLGQGNDDLARSLLRKQLLAQREAAWCDDQLQASQQGADDLERQLQVQRQELERIRQRAGSLPRDSGAGCQPATAYAGSVDRDVITEADVELALLKAKANTQLRPTSGNGGVES
tara:strand:+ start:11092 stop:11793 length:702 start_codon:yes stop_codon:yes gene_type:complete